MLSRSTALDNVRNLESRVSLRSASSRCARAEVTGVEVSPKKRIVPERSIVLNSGVPLRVGVYDEGVHTMRFIFPGWLEPYHPFISD